jgi:hypothetical protein
MRGQSGNPSAFPDQDPPPPDLAELQSPTAPATPSDSPRHVSQASVDEEDTHLSDMILGPVPDTLTRSLQLSDQVRD